MQATGIGRLANAVRGAGTIAVFAGSCVLAACATSPRQWADQTALVIRPSQRQALLAFSFGADPPHQDAGLNTRRNIAATIAETAVLRDSTLPALDTMEIRNGRLSIHPPRARQGCP